MLDREYIERRRTNSAGFSMIELMAVITVSAILFLYIFSAVPKWQDAFYDNNNAAYNNDCARNVFAKICNEIRESGWDAPDWNLNASSNTITFNRCTGAVGATRTWDVPITYTYDAQNKALVRTSGGRSVTICGNVTSVTFTPQGNNVMITLTIGTTSAKGRSLSINLTSLILPRD